MFELIALIISILGVIIPLLLPGGLLSKYIKTYIDKNKLKKELIYYYNNQGKLVNSYTNKNLDNIDESIIETLENFLIDTSSLAVLTNKKDKRTQVIDEINKNLRFKCLIDILNINNFTELYLKDLRLKSELKDKSKYIDLNYKTDEINLKALNLLINSDDFNINKFLYKGFITHSNNYNIICFEIVILSMIFKINLNNILFLLIKSHNINIEKKEFNNLIKNKDLKNSKEDLNNFICELYVLKEIKSKGFKNIFKVIDFVSKNANNYYNNDCYTHSLSFFCNSFPIHYTTHKDTKNYSNFNKIILAIKISMLIYNNNFTKISEQNLLKFLKYIPRTPLDIEYMEILNIYILYKNRNNKDINYDFILDNQTIEKLNTPDT